MKPAPAEVQAAIDRVIAGMDRLGRGESWPKADARAAAKAARARRAMETAGAAWAAVRAAAAQWSAAADAAAAAAWAATFADVPRARQRDILFRLIEEASE
jgi:hypothetical protein